MDHSDWESVPLQTKLPARPPALPKAASAMSVHSRLGSPGALRPWAGGGLLALAGLAGLACWRGIAASGTSSARLEIIAESSRSAAFEQCDGPKALKCEIGCLCQVKNEYFSMCQPLGGLLKCSKELAEKHLEHAKAKAAPVKKLADAADEARAKADKRFDKASVEASELNLAAAHAESQEAVLRDNATEEAAKLVRAAKVKAARAKVKEKQAAKAKVQALAAKRAAEQVKNATLLVTQAEDALLKVKDNVTREVAQKIRSQKDKVEQAEALLKKMKATQLGPLQVERTAIAAEAAKKAEVTAAAAKAAAKKAEDAEAAKSTAEKEADEAAKALGPAGDEVKKWESALKF